MTGGVPTLYNSAATSTVATAPTVLYDVIKTAARKARNGGMEKCLIKREVDAIFNA
jgi:hypothetical protein